MEVVKYLTKQTPQIFSKTSAFWIRLIHLDDFPILSPYPSVNQSPISTYVQPQILVTAQNVITVLSHPISSSVA